MNTVEEYYEFHESGEELIRAKRQWLHHGDICPECGCIDLEWEDIMNDIYYCPECKWIGKIEGRY